jgi:hypothetical protein
MSPSRARLSALINTVLVPLSLALAILVEEGRRWW